MNRLGSKMFDYIARKSHLAPSWRDACFATEVETYARRFAQAQKKLKIFDNRNTSNFETLMTYENKVQKTMGKHENAASLLRTCLCDLKGAKNDIESLESKNQKLSEALAVIKARTQLLHDQRQTLAEQHDKALQELLQVFSSTGLIEEPADSLGCVSDDKTLRFEELDRIAKSATRLETILAEVLLDREEASEYDCLDNNIENEVIARQEVTENLKLDWSKANAAIRRLRAQSNSQTAQEELEEAIKERDWLGIQLALHGYPNRDGEFIVLELGTASSVANGNEKITEPEEQKSQNSSHDTTDLHDNDHTPDAELELSGQHGLFDPAPVSIVRPRKRREAEYEVSETGAQFKDIVAGRVKPMVEKWQDEINLDESSEDSAQSPAQSNTSSNTDSNVATLVEPEVNDSLSCVEKIGPPPYDEQLDRKIRLGAWRIQLQHNRNAAITTAKELSPWMNISGLERGGQPDLRDRKMIDQCTGEKPERQEIQVLRVEKCREPDQQVSRRSKKQKAGTVRSDWDPLRSVCNV